MPPEYPWEMSRERLLEVLNATMAERDRLRAALRSIQAVAVMTQSDHARGRLRMPSHTDELVVNALVKLRQRIAGEEVRLTQVEAQALYLAVLPQAGRVEPALTHGRHCSCSACAREDWTRITGPCGMHGPGCPAVYAPMTSGPVSVTPPDQAEDA